MLIGSSSGDLGISASVFEPCTNREASSYIISNYNELISIVRKYDIKDEKAQDLLHDVYISIVDAEDNGEGFDMEFGSRVDTDGNVDFNIMDVGQFVIGRIRLYARNPRYRTDIIESVNGHVYQTTTYTENVLDENGQEVIGKDGQVKSIRKTERKKVQIAITANAASFNEGGDISENNDDFQKAFATASVADSTDDVAEIMSLREQIDYCIDICELHGINILNILKNMDRLADMLGEYSRKKKTAEGVFNKISELVEYHSELGETLMDIIRFSSKNKAAFELVIQSY
ncbi:MAG: hypothetical protein J6A59_17035 [Lachnospiraceae bacterium]|nr:hypothetical protein [Lachnospiraceae bacterium]